MLRSSFRFDILSLGCLGRLAALPVCLYSATSTGAYQIDMKLVELDQSVSGYYPTYYTELLRVLRQDAMACNIECSSVEGCSSAFYDTHTHICTCIEERFHEFAFLQTASDVIYYGISKACPSGWLFYGSSCYFIDTTQRRNIDDSKDVCVSLSSHIIRLETAEENAFIKGEVFKLTTVTEPLLIGLTNRYTDGPFVWEDTMELPDFTDWDVDQPQNVGENCTTLHDSLRKWHDVTCDDNSYFVICELDTNTWG